MKAPKELKNKMEHLTGYIAEWKRMYDFVRLSRQANTVDPDAEKEFLKAKSYLARAYPTVANACVLGAGHKLSVNPLNVVNQAVSLDHLHGMPDIQARKFETDWHTVLIELNQCLGELDAVQNELSNLSWLDKCKIRFMPRWEYIVYPFLIFLLLAVGWFFLFKMNVFEGVNVQSLIDIVKEKLSRAP